MTKYQKLLITLSLLFIIFSCKTIGKYNIQDLNSIEEDQIYIGRFFESVLDESVFNKHIIMSYLENKHDGKNLLIKGKKGGFAIVNLGVFATPRYPYIDVEISMNITFGNFDTGDIMIDNKSKMKYSFKLTVDYYNHTNIVDSSLNMNGKIKYTGKKDGNAKFDLKYKNITEESCNITGIMNINGVKIKASDFSPFFNKKKIEEAAKNII